MSNKDLTSIRQLFEDIGAPDPKKLPAPSKAKPGPEAIDLTPFPAGAFDDVIRPEDVGYTHPVLLQCFLPVRHNKSNAQWWQTNCGRASIAINAGRLVNPSKPNTFTQHVVPAGPKARIITGYINDFIYRERVQTVSLGESMRQAMEKMGVPVGGKNGDELTREIMNFAAAEIMLGVWNQDGSAHQTGGKVSKALSFWIERDATQRTFWQPEMTVSGDYFEAVTQREMTPFYWPALLKLAHNPRAMDIHCFLTYRLHKGLARPVTLSRTVLHSMFGQGIKLEKQFWPEFKTALLEAHGQYPAARIELLKDGKGNDTGIRLKDSPPLIPHRKLARVR